MTASITLYESVAEYLADGTIDLDTDTFKVALCTSSYTPNAGTHTVYSDLTNELSTANGYTSGGATLGSVMWTRSGGTATLDAADTEWTASGAGITARYAVVYKSGGTNPLIAYILMDTSPADVSVTAGNKLTLQWNGSGILTLAIS